MPLETFAPAFPADQIAENTTPGCITDVSDTIPVVCDVTAGARAAVITKARECGWVHVGSGDLRPDALASWTPPDTSVAYTGVSILGNGVPLLIEVNDLRVKLGLAVARMDQLEALLDAHGITDGK